MVSVGASPTFSTNHTAVWLTETVKFSFNYLVGHHHLPVKVDGVFNHVPWCNGSTSDFGSDGQGSNPCGTTSMTTSLLDNI